VLDFLTYRTCKPSLGSAEKLLTVLGPILPACCGLK
jgi:hypothetical protein